MNGLRSTSPDGHATLGARSFPAGMLVARLQPTVCRLDAANRGERSMSTITAAAAVTRKPLYTSLFVQVLAALLLGIVLGMATPDFAVSLKIFSDAFLKLISMIVAPIVFCVVVHGIAGAGDLKKVGTGRRQGAGLFRGHDHGRAGRRPGARLFVRPRPRHEHRSLDARCQGAQYLRRQRAQAAGRRHRQLPPQHHSDHLVRRAVAQRRAAGAVLRHHLRRQPGAGRRREGRAHQFVHRCGIDRPVPGDGADRAPRARSACSARSPIRSENMASARSGN